MKNKKRIFLIISILYWGRPLKASDISENNILVTQVEKNFILGKKDNEIKKLKGRPWRIKSRQLKTIQIKSNDTISFYNADDFKHVVYSSFFSAKVQKPKETSQIKFPKEGVYKIRCAIHPQMELEVEVKK